MSQVVSTCLVSTWPQVQSSALHKRCVVVCTFQHSTWKMDTGSEIQGHPLRQLVSAQPGTPYPLSTKQKQRMESRLKVLKKQGTEGRRCGLVAPPVLRACGYYLIYSHTSQVRKARLLLYSEIR